MSLDFPRMDTQQFITELQNELGTKNSWTSLLTTSTGQALIEFIADIGTEAVYADERSYQETFLSTARLDSSIRERARHLGVRLNRKLPASVSVTLTRTATGVTQTLPQYSSFYTNAGVQLFNRTALTFNPSDVTINVTLYEGYYTTYFALGTGNDWQTYISAETGFSVSDEDVNVWLNDTIVPVVTDGFWRYGNKSAVRDQTTKNGQLELMFGNTFYGTSPGASSTVQLSYIVTKGSAANNGAFSGTTITYTSDNTITGVATSGLSGGADETSTAVYKRISSLVFASGDRAVSGAEYNAMALQYPGIIDAQIVGQNKLGPTNLQFMNLVRISLLTETTWSNTDWQNFIIWFERRAMYSTRYYQQANYPSNYTINVIVYCDSGGDLSSIQSAVATALTSLTALKQGSLGGSIYRSDIYRAIQTSSPEIIYSLVNSPTTDIVTIVDPPVPVITETSSGSYATSTVVNYAITATRQYNPGSGLVTGESLPFYTNHTVVLNSSNLVLTWPIILSNAYTVRIYKYNGTVYGLIGEVVSSAVTFTDTGALSINASINPTNTDTTQVFYPNCTNIAVSTQFSGQFGSGWLYPF